MLRIINRFLVPFILILALLIARPSFSSPVALAQADTSTPDNSADQLDPSFWIADNLDLKTALAAANSPLNDWLQSVNQSNIEFLCLGETHNEAFRRFIAESILPQLDVDVLMLETDADQATQLASRAAAANATTMLLGADVAPVIRAVKTRNPDVQVVGVDDTEQQTAWMNLERANTERRRLSRDGFIAQNIRQQFRPGQHHVALYGANHCASHDLGLGNSRPFFRHLAGVLTPRDRMKSVLITSSTQTNPFTLALKNVGLENELVIIPDTQAMSPATYNFRWDLKSFFDNYDVLIQFP